MLRVLEAIGSTSQHMKTLIQGLRDITVIQARDNISAIQSSIGECKSRTLKRLEVEMRLLQLAFHMVLVVLGTDSKLEILYCKDQIKSLCTTYPDTAGKFHRSYMALNPSIHCGKLLNDINYKDTWEYWRKWGKYETGDVMYCRFGHPFSGKNFSDCPECGKEVVKPPQVDVVECAKHLHEDAFVECLKKMLVRA